MGAATLESPTMATFLICFDLNNENEEYDRTRRKLIKRVKSLFPNRWSRLDSTYVVVSDMTAKEIRNDLRECLDDDDELLVVKSGGVGAWHGFGAATRKWMKTNL